MWQLSENSRLCFRVAGSTLQQGFGPGKYLIGIGDTASVVPNPWPESLKAQNQGQNQPQQTSTTLDKDKVADYMDKHASTKSQGECAAACRRGLKAGALIPKTIQVKRKITVPS